MTPLSSAQGTPAGWGSVLFLGIVGTVCLLVGTRLMVRKEDCADAMDEYLRVRLPRMSLLGGVLCLAAALWGAIRLLSAS
jgi:hypothetical protein